MENSLEKEEGIYIHVNMIIQKIFSEMENSLEKEERIYIHVNMITYVGVLWIFLM